MENKVLNKFHNSIRFYFRYVDDIVLSAPTHLTDDIVSTFNAFHDRIKFTTELEENRCINFLDLSIHVVNNKLKIDWFHKKTFSGRFLSFFPHHPFCHKKGTIFSLIDRAILLSHPDFHTKNIILVVNILLNNGYPLDFIFNNINVRIKKIISKKINNSFNSNSFNNVDRSLIVLSYINNVSEHISTAFNKSEVILSYKCFNRLNKIIKGSCYA